MIIKPTKDDLLKAIEQDHCLTEFGIGIWGNPGADCLLKTESPSDLQKQRVVLEENGLRMFQICCAWLSLCKRRKTINLKISHSYGLKHQVSRYFDEYVTNGAFIAALIHMSVRYQKYGNFPNVDVALSSRLPDDKMTKQADIDRFFWEDVKLKSFNSDTFDLYCVQYSQYSDDNNMFAFHYEPLSSALDSNLQDFWDNNRRSNKWQIIFIGPIEDCVTTIELLVKEPNRREAAQNGGATGC